MGQGELTMAWSIPRSSQLFPRASLRHAKPLLPSGSSRLPWDNGMGQDMCAGTNRAWKKGGEGGMKVNR